MKLQITQTNINEGRRNKSHHCPIALALKDAGWEYACVRPDIIYCRKYPAIGKHFYHSLQSQIFMQHFDSGLVVIPTTIELQETSSKSG